MTDTLLFSIDETETRISFPTKALPAHTMPIGSKTLTADYLHGDPPAAAELSAALSIVELHIDDLKRAFDDFAATLTSCDLRGDSLIADLAAIEIGNDAFASNETNFVFTAEAAEDVFRTLATENTQDRAHNPGLRPDRVGHIVGAGCILVELFRQLAIPALHVDIAAVTA